MPQPTVVLVHGAFADASTYAPVTKALLDEGISVLAPAVPNRSLLGDAREIRFVVEQLDGPVLLVGHSYGGAVITVAGAADNVVGLVYLAGYALDEGESLAELQGGFPDSELTAALVQTDVPASVAGEARVDVTVVPERFGPVIGADVDPELIATLAVSQRPLAAAAFVEAAPGAAWRSKRSWAVVAADDHAINPDVQRFGYQRAGATTMEINSSHLVTLSHPQEVAALISAALTEVTV
ncbi:alpha/beta fold hydrolase [Mycolicibacterium aichiense]|uniref:Alpha/beta hydrolase n=1 Tax=Mycolicibacterium aichiense TaxID=1799 RepID=A0AAD1ME95_9MYCO|nr:alpha/beta hydrolase [Mycolicibacterium aichiense]MCV7016502.1 alpha/beta hydrolase [Mycolicibacterium aichiense]BBX09721.1 alpha/beta hydrolase [Mycolicibacterium aichiense]SUA14286.1 alpha/beta hydrolase [Mycolicibacterium aichiense]